MNTMKPETPNFRDMVSLPAFDHCEQAVLIKNAPTPLEYFIYHNTPSGNDNEAVFRYQLSSLLTWWQSHNAQTDPHGGVPPGGSEPKVNR